MARESLQTLSEPMYYVLLSLTEKRFGAEIMQDVLRLSDGRVKVGPGTLYTMLAKFMESGIITETAVEGRKKTYLITDHGRRLLWAEYRRLAEMIEDGRAIMEGLNEQKEQNPAAEQLCTERTGSDAGVSGNNGREGLVPHQNYRLVPEF